MLFSSFRYRLCDYKLAFNGQLLINTLTLLLKEVLKYCRNSILWRHDSLSDVASIYNISYYIGMYFL